MAGRVDQSRAPAGTPPWAQSVTAVAFDCFGTIADFVDEHFIDTFDEICGQYSLDLKGKQLWDRWLEEGKRLWEERGRDPKDLVAGPEPQFLTYRYAWAVQFNRSFEALDAAADGGAASSRLLDQIAAAACFPEVPEVLDTLRGTYRVALLSNADDDFLTSFLQRSGLQFETVVSSEAVRSYKPRAPIFQALCDALGLAPYEVLYVGDSPVADLLGARAAGLPVAWVNRAGVPLPDRVPSPEIEVHDLRGLLDVLPLMGRQEGLHG